MPKEKCTCPACKLVEFLENLLDNTAAKSLEIVADYVESGYHVTIFTAVYGIAWAIELDSDHPAVKFKVSELLKLGLEAVSISISEEEDGKPAIMGTFDAKKGSFGVDQMVAQFKKVVSHNILKLEEMKEPIEADTEKPAFAFKPDYFNGEKGLVLYRYRVFLQKKSCTLEFVLNPTFKFDTITESISFATVMNHSRVIYEREEGERFYRLILQSKGGTHQEMIDEFHGLVDSNIEEINKLLQ